MIVRTLFSFCRKKTNFITFSYILIENVKTSLRSSLKFRFQHVVQQILVIKKTNILYNIVFNFKKKKFKLKKILLHWINAIASYNL